MIYRFLSFCGCCWALLKQFRNLREKLSRERMQKRHREVERKRCQFRPQLRVETYCRENWAIWANIRRAKHIEPYMSLRSPDKCGNKLTVVFCYWRFASNQMVLEYRSCKRKRERRRRDNVWEREIDKICMRFVTIPFRSALSSKRVVLQLNLQNHPRFY